MTEAGRSRAQAEVSAHRDEVEGSVNFLAIAMLTLRISPEL